MDPFSWYMIAMAMVSFLVADDQAGKQSAALSRNYALKENDRARQVAENQRQSAAQMNEQARQAEADKATFATIAGEFGGGKTIDRAQGVFEVQSGERLASIQANAKAGLSQLGFQGIANQGQADSSLAGINRPSLLGTALQIGGTYLGDKQVTARRNTSSNGAAWTEWQKNTYG